MATTSWDSFPAQEFDGGKDHRNGDHKRRHDDRPLYMPPGDGYRKPRQFNNNNNRNGGPHNSKNGDMHRAPGPHYRHENRAAPVGGRQPRTNSEGYDDNRMKSTGGPMMKGNRPPFRNNPAANNGVNHHGDQKFNRNLHNRLESHNEKELRLQVGRMKGHMQYLKDQMAYKDQVIHHKEQVIAALRKKLEALKAGSSETAEPSTTPVEPAKPANLEQMEADLAAAENCDEHDNDNGNDDENGEHQNGEESTEESSEAVETHEVNENAEKTNGDNSEESNDVKVEYDGSEGATKTDDVQKADEEVKAEDTPTEEQTSAEVISEEKPSDEGSA